MSQVSWNENTVITTGNRPFNADPAWLFHEKLMELAQSFYGIKELAGTNHHDQILEFHKSTWLKAPDDETPWCAAFMSYLVNTAAEEFGHDHLTNNTPRALEWAEWGAEVPVQNCQRGDIVVLTRKGGGHVALATGFQNNGHCALLGGNQNNMVCVSDYPSDRIVSVRRANF